MDSRWPGAQCHDHKFDPISQKDYYQFFAYFNTASDIGLDGNSGINSRPSFETRTPLVSEEEVRRLNEEIDRIENEWNQPHPSQNTWEEEHLRHLEHRGKDLAFGSLRPIKITTPNRGNTGRVTADSSLLIDEGGGMAAYNVSAELPVSNAGPVTGLRVVFYSHEVTQGRLGHGQREGFEGSFILTTLTVSKGELPSDQVDLYNIVPLRQVTGSSSHPDFPTFDALDERPINGWAPAQDSSSPQHFTATFSNPIDPNDTPYLTAMLNFGQGSNLIPGYFRLYAMYGTDDGSNVPTDVQEIIFLDVENRSEDQNERLRTYFYDTSSETRDLRIKLANLEERLSVLTEPHSTMIMDVAETPRKTHILNRGQYDQPLEPVEPGTPSLLPAAAEDSPPNRLGLATWLTRPDHPLTARVTVNRFWHLLFGRGIVETTADFGAQGAPPDPPRPPRLVGRQVCGQRVGRESFFETDCHIGDLPAKQRSI